MRYFVITDDGNRYGPADLETLNQWIQEGRLLATTLLEEEASGARIAASAVPELTFPIPAPGATTGQAPGGGASPPTSGPASNPYSAPYQRPGPGGTYAGDYGNNDIVVSWVLGVVGLLCCGIILAPIGIVFANRAKEKGNPGSQAPLVFNIVVTVLSVLGIIYMAINFATFQQRFQGTTPTPYRTPAGPGV